MPVQLTRPGEDLPPFAVPLQKLGPGHYYAPLYDIPYPGEWQMTIRVQLGETDEAVLTGSPSACADVPGVEVTTNFFLVLTLVADAVVVGRGAARGSPRSVSRRARAAVVAVASCGGAAGGAASRGSSRSVTTLGSLYYSEHAGFMPCELCWYQRIVMYPLVIVLGVGWLRRDRKVWMTVLVFVVIGAPLSLYHWLVERVPELRREHVVLGRSRRAPRRTSRSSGFVTLAWMA